MNMREIVSRLQAQGYQIVYYVRKDGGILIKSINGVKYKAAKGNEKARQLVGQEISKARKKQLMYATRQRAKIRKRRKEGVQPLPSALEEEYKRVKKIWNKAFKSKKGESHPAGFFGKTGFEEVFEQQGYEEALHVLSEKEKYATGYAYSKNIEILYEHIMEYAEETGSEVLEKLAEEIIDKMDKIKEEWIAPIYEILYSLNRGVSPKEVARQIRKIIK